MYSLILEGVKIYSVLREDHFSPQQWKIILAKNKNLAIIMTAYQRSKELVFR